MRIGMFLAAAFGLAASGAFAAPDAQQCQTRANDISAKLLECIQEHALWQHLARFQKIADAHPDAQGHGNRDTGSAGYTASVDYVAGLMRRAGYRVTVQPYRWNSVAADGIPVLSSGGRIYVLGNDWFVARLSGAGEARAAVQAAGAGCGDDFSGFVPGRIALLRRGACDLDSAAANAAAAGAAAVVFYAPRSAAFPARLTAVAPIPVAVVSAVVADALARPGANARIAVRMRQVSGIDYNLIAESPYGDPSRTIVVDAHLDAIFGAGMLDNASGSTTILEVALNLAKTPTRNRLRYVWFGGEELGLLGSAYYTTHLGAAALARIAFDLDVDVTATPNFDIQVAAASEAPNRKKFPPNVVPQSAPGDLLFAGYFAGAGVVSEPAPFGNAGTDSNSFSLAGVPNTGILTEQDCCKAEWEVRKWGGFPGNYEGKVPGHNGGCVDRPHVWCDNLSNDDPFVLELASKAVANVVLKLASRPFPN